MKKRLLPALLALSLTLTGCAALLDREYIDVTPYNPTQTAEGDSSVLRAESYQELVNALMYFVTQGTEEGMVRLYVGSQDPDADLEAACLEVVQESPLGAYAVEHIKYSVTPLVTYSEAKVQITYRRSREQIASIANATGITAIRSELRSALSSFDREQVLHISYFDSDEAFIPSLIRQAYLSVPAAALDYPDITVAVYPNSGRQRIVEIGLTYHMEEDELLRRRDDLERKLVQMTASLPTMEGDALLHELLADLSAVAAYSPEGGSTAYHALLEGSANSEGMALALAAFCSQAKFSCLVVEGTLQDAPHFWNLIKTSRGWLHLDLTTYDGTEFTFCLDSVMEEAGYVWDADALSQSQAVPYS